MNMTDMLDEAAELLTSLLRRQRAFGMRLARIVERETGLSALQAGSLLAVQDGARRVRDVAEETFQHVSGASRVVDSLVTAELVRREPDTEDRRQVVLELTADGGKAADEVRDVYRRTVRDIFEHAEDDVAARLPALEIAFLDAADKVLGD